MTFVWLIWYTLPYTFFEFAICFIVLMNLGETCHLKRRDLVTVWQTMLLLLCCYHCDCMQQHYDVMQFEYILWHHTMHEWVMNIHYKTWIAQGRFTKIILTPSIMEKTGYIISEPQHILEKFGRKQTMFWQANNIFWRERQEFLLIILEKTDHVTTGLHNIFKKKLCVKYEELCVSHLCQPVQCQGNRPALGWWCAYSGGLCHPTHQATAPGSNGGDIICRGLINSLAPGRPRCYFKTAIWNLVLLISIFTSFKDNALRWMPRDLTDDKSTLVQVMAWCRQATSNYLNQCWPRSLLPNGVTRPQWVKMANIFVTDTLKFIFENENFQISNKISFR